MCVYIYIYMSTRIYDLIANHCTRGLSTLAAAVFTTPVLAMPTCRRILNT